MSYITPNSSGLVTIRYVVMSVLNRLQDYSLKNYLRYTQIAIEGFGEELSMFHINAGLQVVYLHMSLGKTIPIPADFINYNRIAYPVDGKLRVITRKDAILLPRTYDDTGDVVGNADAGNEIGTTSGLYLFPPHYHGGRYVSALYGLPGGVDTANFRIDREAGLIVFSGSTPRSEVVMEYVTNGLLPDGSSLIPRECVPALRTYVLWQKDENDFRIPYNAKARLKQEHEEAVEALKSFTLSFTADEYLAMIRSGIHQSIKR